MRQTRRLVEARPKGPKLEARTADSGAGVLGRRQRAPSPQPPPHQLGSLGERYKLPQRGPGQSPGKFGFWSILRPHKSCQNGQIMSKTNRTWKWKTGYAYLLLKFALTRRLQRYTWSPEIHGRNPENSGQTRRVGNPR